MLIDTLIFAAGLIVGWNVLPQPYWALRIWNRVVHGERF